MHISGWRRAVRPCTVTTSAAPPPGGTTKFGPWTTSVFPARWRALGTSNCDQAARAMRAAGVGLLEVGANYYDDLAARFALSPEVVDRMREHRMLYDKDASGTFLHAYTPPIGELYFEIVERQGGYDGYGAPNASVRLAAMRPEPFVRRG